MAKPGVKPMPEAERTLVRDRFVTAAHDLLEEVGLEALNTKLIGQRAGYSHTSIYNYFTDFNELLCLAVERTAQACCDSVAADLDRLEKEAAAGLSAEALVTEFARLMTAYNTATPHRYYPFLSTRLDFSFFRNRDGRPFAHPAYALFLERLGPRTGEAGNDEGQRRIFADILTYIFHSKLHFFLRFGVPATVGQLQAEVGQEVAYLLARARSTTR